MIINEVLGIQTITDPSIRITTRQAVRAIVIKDNKILMVHTNKGDYKFPGGGIKKLETHEEALRREVTEETGYIVDQMKNKAGVIIQRNPNQFDANGIFQMTSYYYFCNVKQKTTNQHLDKYEKEQEFEPIWIELDEVIAKNEAILTQKGTQINPWVYRETLALRSIKEARVMGRSHK
ncbi:MAG: NUDIX domain-containing protein [Candidatus Cellulosilyticum pullistercoris]|uniref:NUDIX domain-containing protein n=1 Tax=Candidatus Cellulosilyticum pullistercoris TaxID=2838521 RepID=A0A9E2KDK9_9FIRM|nr:NUDIX domain-containing protein [Candidatus Cellulosilyticum pullistercoris]